MKKTAKIGFVGCGSHSTHNIYPALKYANCDLDAVCDIKEEMARRNASIYGAASWFTDLEKMLGSRKLDGVMAVGSPDMHYQAAKRALGLGLPVFVEKPATPNLGMYDELVALARSKGVFLMTGFMKRHGLAYAKIREAIQADRFQPGAGLLKYGHWPCGDIREMLMFMSIHIIDLAVSFFGKPASVTSASCRRNRDGALTLAVTLRFQSGRLAQLVLDSGQPRIQERVEISGMMDGGSAMYVVDNVQHMELHRQGSNGIDLLAPTMQEISPAINLDDIRVWRPDYGIPNMGQTRLFFQGFAGEVREFVNAVNEHREPYPGMDDAREAMRIVEAISATPDGVVELR